MKDAKVVTIKAPDKPMGLRARLDMLGASFIPVDLMKAMPKLTPETLMPLRGPEIIDRVEKVLAAMPGQGDGVTVYVNPVFMRMVRRGRVQRCMRHRRAAENV